MSPRSKDELEELAKAFDCRLWHEDGDHYFQTKETSGYFGGHVMTGEDGSKWLKVGMRSDGSPMSSR
eukprot:1196554-Karenia_brevis.AAC.1